MDASRDIMESAKPPKPPRAGGSPESVEGERSSQPLLWTVVACAVAIATFSGITAWETHQDRVNTEVIYCTLFSGISGIETDDDGDARATADRLLRRFGHSRPPRVRTAAVRHLFSKPTAA